MNRSWPARVWERPCPNPPIQTINPSGSDWWFGLIAAEQAVASHASIKNQEAQRTAHQIAAVNHSKQTSSLAGSQGIEGMTDPEPSLAAPLVKVIIPAESWLNFLEVKGVKQTHRGPKRMDLNYPWFPLYLFSLTLCWGGG